MPPTHPEIAGLVNSLVAEEECDLLPENFGGPLHLSHFAFYRRAMLEIEANTSVTDAVLQLLRTNQELIASGEVHAVTAAFAYGRELHVLDVFRGLLDRITALELPCPTLPGTSNATSHWTATAMGRWRKRWCSPWPDPFLCRFTALMGAWWPLLPLTASLPEYV